MPDNRGMANTDYPREPVPLNVAARCLRVPAGWLRAEIDARRIPALLAGRSVLVHVPTVLPLLTERAQGKEPVTCEQAKPSEAAPA